MARCLFRSGPEDGPAHGAVIARGWWSVSISDPSEMWVANFQPGGGGWEGVLEHPNREHVIVVSRGQGYVVDPASQHLVHTYSGSIQHVVELPDLETIVVSDGLRFEAIKRAGIWWSSPRISWDEIKNIKVEGTILRGEASTPAGDGDTWVPFTLDLMTGQCEDGIYQRDMQHAIPVRFAPH